ncbi:MAG: hypothetical protein WBV92_07910 [Nitrosotalea sp.]
MRLRNKKVVPYDSPTQPHKKISNRSIRKVMSEARHEHRLTMIQSRWICNVCGRTVARTGNHTWLLAIVMVIIGQNLAFSYIF